MEHLGFLPDFAISKRQRRRVEVWSYVLPKTEWENEDLTLILREKMDFLADFRYKCFQC
jgi:hypothetical protein